MLSIFVATAEIHSRPLTKEALSAAEKVLARPGLRFSGRSMPVSVPGCVKGVLDASLLRRPYRSSREARLMLLAVHHVAIICSDYEASKQFYINKLGFAVLAENWRPERQSWKCDLRHGPIQIELFSFPDPPSRPSRPEACGLRHIAFVVASVEATAELLRSQGVEVEPIRTDPYTGRLFTFIADPDGLPIELYQDGV